MVKKMDEGGVTDGEGPIEKWSGLQEDLFS